MRILYIASSGGPGGASKALLNLINRLNNVCEIHVVFPDKGTFSLYVEQQNIRVYYIKYFLNIYPSFYAIGDKIKFPYRLFKVLYFNYRATNELLKIANQIKPDIIHSNVGPIPIGYFVARKLNIKHVWHLREYQDLDFGMHFIPSKSYFKKLLLDSNNYPIAITRGISKYWNLGLKDKVIYDGVIDSNSHDPICEKDKFFLFVGRIEDAKGVDLLLDAFIIFAQHNFNHKLIIIGNGSELYINQCKLKLKNKNLEARVDFLGHRNDVFYYMERAKALIVPSRFEAFGFITAEAMFNHCLVIGKNTAGTKEQFDLGLKQMGVEIGIRFESLEDLVDALINVSEMNDLFSNNKMLISAYDVVINNYSIEKHKSMIMSYYKEITHQSAM